MAGRKTLKDELGILRRYADLTEPYFKFLNQMLTSANKKDKMWAAEQLKNAYPKFIPQTLEGSGENGELQVQVINYGNSPSQVSAPPLPTTTTPSD